MNTQKTMKWSGVALGGLGAAAYVLSDRKRRVKAQEKIYELAQKVPFVKMEQDKEVPVEKGGHPDPYDLADNNMVAEGAQTSVQYYNDTKNMQ